MILSCQNIKKQFGEVAILNRCSFHIEDYEKAAVIGINGAGKTTLLRIIAGEMSADEGVVMHGGAIMTLLSCCAVPRRRSLEWTSDFGRGYGVLVTPSLYHSSGVIEVFEEI